MWQIGNEGGFLAGPVNLTADHGNRLLMALAERADVIVDFTNVPVGDYVLANVGPDEPFGGGVPGDDFEVADPATTGQVMQFRVLPATAPDRLDPAAVPPATRDHASARGDAYPAAGADRGSGRGRRRRRRRVEGPVEALLGTVGPDAIDDGTPAGVWTVRRWMDPVTENPAVGATEVWEIYNTTADAHPMHVHELVFEVVNRRGPRPGRRGRGRSRSSSTASSPLRSPGKPGSRTR